MEGLMDKYDVDFDIVINISFVIIFFILYCI